MGLAPAIIPFGIEGEFHDAAPHRRHNASASWKLDTLKEKTSSAGHSRRILVGSLA